MHLDMFNLVVTTPTVVVVSALFMTPAVLCTPPIVGGTFQHFALHPEASS
jgi:hypothetical protein